MDFNELRKNLILFYDKHSNLEQKLNIDKFLTFEDVDDNIKEYDIHMMSNLRWIRLLFNCNNLDYNYADITRLRHFWSKDSYYIIKKEFEDRIMIAIIFKNNYNSSYLSIVKYNKEFDECIVVFGQPCTVEKHDLDLKF